jgi:hypothetical protein
MRKSSKVLGAVVVASVVAAGGAAFTNSNTFASGATAPLTGYASTSVSGGVINSLKYNLSAAGDSVTSVTLVLATDTTSSAVSIGFNGDPTSACGTGTYSSINTQTTYTCDNGGLGLGQTTSGLTSTAVVVN